MSTTPTKPPAEDSDALLSYLKDLTVSTFNRHYAQDEVYTSGRATWAPFDDMAGLLCQLDNMLSGLSRTAQTSGAIHEI